MPPPDRYARQRLIQWWDQGKLRAASVLVAGAGALGNEVLKNLALLGVGRLLVIDFDRIEPSNLSRTVLFTEDDVGRPKASAAASALARLNPEVETRAIDGDLFHDVGLGHYRHSQLVIGCLDNLAARSRVGQSCVLAGVPYLDGGMWWLGGEVRWFTAGDGPCFDCTLSPDDIDRADERRSCTGFREPDPEAPEAVPTVATTASVIGGMLAQEAVKYLCGHAPRPGRALVYNGQALTLHRAELSRNPRCPSTHRPYAEVRELPRRAGEVTPRQLFALARDEGIPGPLTLELGRDLLLALCCPGCGAREEVRRPIARVGEGERACPRCATTRQPEVIHSLQEDSPDHLDEPLARLGVPPGEVLAVHDGEAVRLLELTADG